MRAVYVVLIWVNPGQQDALHAYEGQVAPILARYDGRFDRAVDVSEVSDTAVFVDGAPDEVHILSFPDDEAFSQWRADPDMSALGDQRNAAVARVLFLSGTAIEFA